MINMRVNTTAFHEANLAIRVLAAELIDKSTRAKLQFWGSAVTTAIRVGAKGFFRYKNPQPGARQSNLAGSLWVGDVKATKGNTGLEVEMGAAVFYDRILEQGPTKKAWDIVPRGAVRQRVGGARRGVRFLRWMEGGKFHFARKVHQVWRPRSLRPHWAPVMVQMEKRIFADLESVTPKALAAAMKHVKGDL